MKRIYLDNCCFNRPFDDQQSVKVRLETEAKLYIQQLVLDKKLELIWSYMLDYENAANPFVERRISIEAWRNRAIADVDASPNVVAHAKTLQATGLKPKDALHMACAVEAGCDDFITTDKGILHRSAETESVQILNPPAWIEQMEEE